MLVRLADAAQSGLADPREQVAPFVELALRLRDAARAGKRFAEADAVRDTLLDCGIEIRDTRDGTDWLLTQVTRSAGGL
jgi:cysteinyl-tRNA synthetase